MWRWLWWVGPRLFTAFQHFAERYRSVREDRQVSSTPIIWPNIEMVELPRVSASRPRQQPPPVPASAPSRLPPLPSRSAGPNTTSSVWDDSELGE